MIFNKTPLEGAYTIELEKRGDDRGFFARLFCENEFQEHGLESKFVQINNSVSLQRGTLRGLHYQKNPKEEVKIVRCVRGAVYDVIVDMRPDSITYKKWFGKELTEENRVMMYVPKGFAHGFITLKDNSEMIYLSSTPYSQEYEAGVRYNDNSISINWPLQPIVITQKDENWPSV